MNKQEEIREGMKGILTEDLIVCGFTHENPPPHKDCGEDCGVSLDDQIAAANPVCSPVRSDGTKHKRCMACWNEYIDELVTRVLKKQDSQDVMIVSKPKGNLEGACLVMVEPLVKDGH